MEMVTARRTLFLRRQDDLEDIRDINSVPVLNLESR